MIIAQRQYILSGWIAGNPVTASMSCSCYANTSLSGTNISTAVLEITATANVLCNPIGLIYSDGNSQALATIVCDGIAIRLAELNTHSYCYVELVPNLIISSLNISTWGISETYCHGINLFEPSGESFGVAYSYCNPVIVISGSGEVNTTVDSYLIPTKIHLSSISLNAIVDTHIIPNYYYYVSLNTNSTVDTQLDVTKLIYGSMETAVNAFSNLSGLVILGGKKQIYINSMGRFTVAEIQGRLLFRGENNRLYIGSPSTNFIKYYLGKIIITNN